jgi:hypothetical protein
MTAAPIPSELELEMNSERSRWLRRRLLYLCVVGIALTVLLEAPDTIHHLMAPDRLHRKAGWIQAAECQLIVAIYAATWAFARTRHLRQGPLLRLVFWMVVTVALVELVGERLTIEPLLAAAPPDPHVSAALIANLSAMLALGFDHFLACLFMPWTVREALRPACVMLAMLSLAVGADVLRHRLSDAGLVMVPILAAGFVPGLLICWWRFSRFRRTFRLQFESSQYRRLQSELTSARRLHEALLPPQRREGPIRLYYAYEPMRQIGGDLLFVHPASAAHPALSVIVLDVTGHGIAAALTVNRLVGEIERLFAESPDASPDAILRGLNRYIALTLARHSIYATALCLHLDTRTGTLRWANGGHPPAFLRRADGRLEELAASAPLLGVLDADQFLEETPATTLHPGDVLLVYTDGVFEAVDPDGRQLGIDGLRRFVQEVCASDHRHEWPGRLLERVLRYRQSPVEDDTLVVALYPAS